MYYNLVRVHKTLRTTPVEASGVTKRLWAIRDMVGAGSVGATRKPPRASRGHMLLCLTIKLPARLPSTGF
jgi:hypothetical protein